MVCSYMQPSEPTCFQRKRAPCGVGSDVVLLVGIRVQTWTLNSSMYAQAPARHASNFWRMGIYFVTASKRGAPNGKCSSSFAHLPSPPVKTRRESPPALSTPSCLLALIFLLAFHLLPALDRPSLVRIASGHPLSNLACHPRFCNSLCFVHSPSRWTATLCPFRVCLVSKTTCVSYTFCYLRHR